MTSTALRLRRYSRAIDVFVHCESETRQPQRNVFPLAGKSQQRELAAFGASKSGGNRGFLLKVGDYWLQFATCLPITAGAATNEIEVPQLS